MFFQSINIRQVPRDLANVNAWNTMFDPYNVHYPQQTHSQDTAHLEIKGTR